MKQESFSLKDITDEAGIDFEDLLNTIHRFLSRLQRIPDSTFLYATSNIGNKVQSIFLIYFIHNILFSK